MDEPVAARPADPAGPRRARPAGRVWRAAPVVVCVLAGVLFGTAHSWSQGKDIDNRSVELSAVVHDAENRVAAAAALAGQLQDQVDAAAAGDLSPQVEAVRQQAAGLDAAAGLTAVTGPGLRVSLSDAPRDADGNYPAGVDPDDLVVHQQDVQSVVNALWAGGAEAMMIMDQRVLTTSAVRCIGNTLLLQGRTYSPPFVVTAIGDPERMREQMAAEPGVRLFQKYVDKFDLGFEIEERQGAAGSAGRAADGTDRWTVPAYNDPIRLATARTGTG